MSIQYVGIDATCWTMRRGFGRHTRCLLRALVEVDHRNKYIFHVDSPDALPSLPSSAEVRVIRTSSSTIVAASARGPRRLRDIAAMSRALSSKDLDVVLFPTLYSYVPTFGRGRRFVMIHDVSAEMYPALTLGGWKNRLSWSAKAVLARRQADVIVTVSEYSRRAIGARFGVNPEKVHVVGEASDPVFRVLDRPEPTAKLRQLNVDGSRRALVHVGGFSPHKNLHALVRAFGRLSKAPDLADVDLLLVGDYDHESFVSCYPELVRLVQSLALESRITFTGYLPDEDLVVLLNLATVLALPSLTEGFGLPAVEAAACGCPVVATTESPLPDLLGDAGRYFDPRDDQALERTLAEVLRSDALRRQMAAAGVKAAGRLSWQEAARRLVNLIDAADPG